MNDKKEKICTAIFTVVCVAAGGICIWRACIAMLNICKSENVMFETITGLFALTTLTFMCIYAIDGISALRKKETSVPEEEQKHENIKA